MSLADKNNNDNQPDQAITREIKVRLRKDALPCAVAFDIAGKLGCTPAEVGRTADQLHIRLVKCQLGLFGYKPQKKIVASRMPRESALGDAIRDGLIDDRLPCKTAWRIAAQFGVPKMTVSGVCEALGIKIKPCQLGAF